jgi:hypothetical protein
MIEINAPRTFENALKVFELKVYIKNNIQNEEYKQAKYRACM